jgi:hypothetical protein
MDHKEEAKETGRYERPDLTDYGTLVEMTAGCLGPGTDDAGFPTTTIFPSASPAFGDPGLCQ